jgi:hypothetical protein
MLGKIFFLQRIIANLRQIAVLLGRICTCQNLFMWRHQSTDLQPDGKTARVGHLVIK